MLHVFFGNDRASTRDAAGKFIDARVQDGDFTEVTAETYLEGVLVDLAGAQSLFSPEEIVRIDMLSEDEGAFSALIEHAELLNASANTFVVIEGPLDVDTKRVLAQHAEQLTECKKSTGTRFNTFALADALLARDKKTLWLLLQEAWRSGVRDEEIVGALMWQFKMLRLAARTKSAKEAEQKEYPYNKAKRALSRFTRTELDSLAHDLLQLYHEGHGRERDLPIALERWVLTL
jgi:DNA polymerase III delta subunit